MVGSTFKQTTNKQREEEGEEVQQMQYAVVKPGHAV